MKTITKTFNIYEYDELTIEAQWQALNNLSDINVDYDWWACTYEDAENVHLKITFFDDHEIGMEFINYSADTAEAILKDHGETCDTYKIAKTFLDEYQNAINTGAIENDIDVESLEHEFLNDLRKCYLVMPVSYTHLTLPTTPYV